MTYTANSAKETPDLDTSDPDTKNDISILRLTLIQKMNTHRLTLHMASKFKSSSFVPKTKVHYFNRPVYQSVVGSRGPNYKSPFKLSDYYKDPSVVDKDSPFFAEFSKNMDVKYAEPYKVYNGRSKFIKLAHDENPSSVGPSVTIEDICAYDKDWDAHYQTPEVLEALKFTKKMFPVLKDPLFGFLYPTLGKTFDVHEVSLINSPGFPFSTDPSSQYLAFVVDRVFQLTEEILKSTFVNEPNKVEAPPCTIETIIPKEKGPVYQGISYPRAVSFLDAMIGGPILMMFRFATPDNDWPLAFNVNATTPSVKLRFYEKAIEGCWVGCRFSFVDFDSSVHPILIDFGFDILQKWCYPNAHEDIRNFFEFVKYYFKNTPILLPSGQLITKHGGIPEDSHCAPFVRSVVRTFVVIYCMQRQGISGRYVKERIHSVNKEVVISVPFNFSAEKLVADAKSIGFCIDEKSIKIAGKREDFYSKQDVSGADV